MDPKKVHPNSNNHLNMNRMKGFIPGVIVGILLLLLLQKNNSEGGASEANNYEDGRVAGYSQGQADAQKLCEQEKQRAVSTAYSAGYDSAMIDCSGQLRSLQTQHAQSFRQQEHFWRTCLKDSILQTVADLQHLYEPQLQELQTTLLTTQSELDQTKVAKGHTEQELLEYKTLLSEIQIDPRSLKSARRVLVGLVSFVLMVLGSVFVKSRVRG